MKPARAPQTGQEEPEIEGVHEQRPAIVTTLDHVMGLSGYDAAEAASHVDGGLFRLGDLMAHPAGVPAAERLL
jgi:hypothetical protein